MKTCVGEEKSEKCECQREDEKQDSEGSCCDRQRRGKGCQIDDGHRSQRDCRTGEDERGLQCAGKEHDHGNTATLILLWS